MLTSYSDDRLTDSVLVKFDATVGRQPIFKNFEVVFLETVNNCDFNYIFIIDNVPRNVFENCD